MQRASASRIARIAKRKQEEKAELRKKMKKLAADAGFDIEEVIGGRGRRGSRGPVAPKYQHPKDASLTWTGRGRQPLWLVAELKAGKKLGGCSVPHGRALSLATADHNMLATHPHKIASIINVAHGD